MDETPDKNQSLPEVGPWARDKLERLEKYLSEYTKIMARQGWADGYVYIDAFAGSGRARIRRATPAQSDALPLLERELADDKDARQILDGSPRVALDVEPPFTRYVFVERDPRRVLLLESLVQEYKGHRHIVIRKKDCNDYLANIIARINWQRWRAVVFLDPFGMQVPWQTIAGLARTKAIEVFLNFPVMGIQRVLRRDMRFTDKDRQKLDLYFGDPRWFEAVYPESADLFGPVQQKAPDSERRLVDWYRKRLETAFGYVSEAYLVTNTRGGHLYFLVFAGPNKTGAKIANYVLQSGTKLRPRP